MKRNILAITTAAALSMAVFAPAASAMENEHTMLVGAVYNALSQLGVETDNIPNLTLAQIAQLREILSGDSMSEGAKKNQIRQILAEAK